MSNPLLVQLVRHGEVASHRGDVPVTEGGIARAVAAGWRLGEELEPGERVFFLYAPTLRARETAAAIRGGAEASLRDAGRRGQVELHAPAEEWALRNPDLYVAGGRVEMVSTPEALAAQTGARRLTAEELSGHRFFRRFWESPDRIGYWVQHPDPPGEDWGAVARRLLTFATSLLDLPAETRRRYVCVTHSPLLRAFVRRYLTREDPGEPDYLESVDLEFSTKGGAAVSFRGRRGVVGDVWGTIAPEG